MLTQRRLFEIHDLIAENLTYHWTIAYLTPGGQSAWLPHVEKNINTFWKPVLWFVKGKYEGKYVGDVVKSAVNDNEKMTHYWGQSVSGFYQLIEKYTNPDDVIYDPFLGGGTTAICALKKGRQFIGSDKDLTIWKKHYDKI